MATSVAGHARCHGRLICQKPVSTERGRLHVATAVVTIPELTRVGLLETEARDAGIDLDVRYTAASGWYSNYRIGETTSAVKILIDRTNDTIVGAHMLGPEYGELINLGALAIKLGLTTRQLKQMTATDPTVTSDLGSML